MDLLLRFDSIQVGHSVDHFTSPEGIPGLPETNFNNRPNSFRVLSPARTCVAYYRVKDLESGGTDVDVVESSFVGDVMAQEAQSVSLSSKIPISFGAKDPDGGESAD